MKIFVLLLLAACFLSSCQNDDAKEAVTINEQDVLFTTIVKEVEDQLAVETQRLESNKQTFATYEVMKTRLKVLEDSLKDIMEQQDRQQANTSDLNRTINDILDNFDDEIVYKMDNLNDRWEIHNNRTQTYIDALRENNNTTILGIPQRNEVNYNVIRAYNNSLSDMNKLLGYLDTGIKAARKNIESKKKKQ
ncbi:hypothetical protein [uncultured Altibacter sp.]|uniref:hypothetical protein n=1 Tax=uncultured Altibacter sp. TaxID=2506933 RepID=UPI0030D755A3